ncbi:exported hypothetical protein [Nitrospina gracilis 3/211]|uniref:Lipoprotein n=1 Tax=Nitrospina gracilis (strain 3/211) TaxID=1266370 RepID=M1YGM4_NITG3|nr:MULTISPECIES: hypothetical protein [Nitrospina]MCF8722665.1 hypothetical protein [Nitrospina sp. Nb-3]CCQ89603.1 exported hypothetical protein [Nitrospina gracilis 3/211]
MKNPVPSRSIYKKCLLVVLAVTLAACAGPQIPKPQDIVNVPQPLMDNTGEFMSPYTQDGVLALWVDKAINAQLGSKVGQMAGAYAGQKALEQVPFVGGILGAQVGEYAGRKIAIEASGGMEYITETSDMSFKNINDMAVYLYARHSTHEHYQQALEATWEIYPDLKNNYYQALVNAGSKR